MVEVMTDKATVEIPSPRAGRVAKRCYAEGQMCPVGKVLVVIELEEGGRAEPAARLRPRPRPRRRRRRRTTSDRARAR